MNEKINIQKLRAGRNLQDTIKDNAAKEEGKLWDFLNRDIQLGSGKLPDKTKEDFYMELASLLSAGIDIQTALELIRDEQKKKKSKDVFSKIVNAVVGGVTLSSALKSNSQFTSYEFHSIQIGEETGKLLPVLKDLATYYQKKIKQRRQLLGAITYPIVVMVIAFAAVAFMVSYVVPMFSDTFRRFGNDLPPITKAVIAFSVFVKRSAGVFFLLMIGLISFAIWQRRKMWFRKSTSKIMMKIPVIGEIIKKIYLARFTNTMALLAGSKIPILQAIQLTRQMITFYPIEQSLISIEDKIMAGTPLYKSLSEYSVYPQKMISVVKVAEEVNQLELFFGRLAEQYADEVEYQTGVLSKFLEPVIIVLLGLVVGVILIAMYLPLFKLGQNF